MALIHKPFGFVFSSSSRQTNKNKNLTEILFFSCFLVSLRAKMESRDDLLMVARHVSLSLFIIRILVYYIQYLTAHPEMENKNKNVCKKTNKLKRLRNRQQSMM